MSAEQNNSLNQNFNSASKILVIGETGSGKSTFINYLTNYFKNGTLDNLRVAIKTKFRPATENYAQSEANTDDTTVSQTTACNPYQFTRNKRDYIFLDTPGLGDTRGKDQDDINIEKIINSVESFDGITCVLIVMNGTVPRLTLNIQNVLVRLQGFLPDVIMENVIIVLTNSYRYSASIDLEKTLKLQSTIHPFYMQNSAFSTDPAKWDQQAMKSLRVDWEISMAELKTLNDLINTFEVKSVQAFTDMKTLRNDIKSMMHKARLEVENIQKIQDEIAALQSGMKGYDDDITKNKDYMRKKVAVAELVDAPYHSTICSVCNHVCHERCGLNETSIKGDKTLSGCACMSSNDQCTVCRGHCSYTQHYHARKTMSNTQQTVDEVLHDIKAKFDAATTSKNIAQQKLTSTTSQKQMLQQALNQKNDEIKKKCLELKKHCSGFNIVEELNIMIKQLETSKQTIKDFDTLRQAETFINSLKAFCNQLEADGAFSDTKSRKKMTIKDTYRPVNTNDSSKFKVASRTKEDDDDQLHDDDDDDNVHHNEPVRKQTTNQSFSNTANTYSGSQQSSRPRQPQQQKQYPKASPTSEAPSGKKIFVGGFKEGALNSDDLKQYFSKFGNLINYFVALHPGGKLRDFGFVEFDNYNTVTDIMKQNHTINGHAVQVKFARRKTGQQFQEQHPRRSDSANNGNRFKGSHNTRQADGQQNDEYSDSSESTKSYGGNQSDPNRPLRDFGKNRPPYGHNRGRPPMRGSPIYHGTQDKNNYQRNEDDSDHAETQDPPGAYHSGRGSNLGRGRGYRGRGAFQQ